MWKWFCRWRADRNFAKAQSALARGRDSLASLHNTRARVWLMRRMLMDARQGTLFTPQQGSRE